MASHNRPSGRLRRGAIAIEYLLILVVIVLPLAAMWPLFLRMISYYGTRVLTPMGLPFP